MPDLKESYSINHSSTEMEGDKTSASRGEEGGGGVGRREGEVDHRSILK